MSVCTGECCRSIVFGVEQLHVMLSDGDRTVASMLTAVAHGEDWVGFTCKHWDPDTRRCKEYEVRPRMCSRYPYDGVCGYCGLVGPEAADQPQYVFSGWAYPVDISPLLPQVEL